MVYLLISLALLNALFLGANLVARAYLRHMQVQLESRLNALDDIEASAQSLYQESAVYYTEALRLSGDDSNAYLQN